MAESPERSKYTSAFERIQARWQRKLQAESPSECDEPLKDNWLAPIFVGEQEEARSQTLTQTVKDLDSQDGQGDLTGTQELAPTELAAGEQGAVRSNPIGTGRLTNKGFLSMTLDQYLALLDCVGRVIRSDKRGAIPPDLPPILNRLSLDAGAWLDSVLDRFEYKANSSVRPAAVP